MSTPFSKMALFVIAATLIYCIAQRPLIAFDSPNEKSTGLADRVEKLERRINQLSSDFGIGTVVFSSSNTPPGDNWVICDGKTNFPENAPPHLRSKPVPNLVGALVAVGDPTKPRVDGRLDTQPVSGEEFALPKPAEKRIAADKGNPTNPNFKGGLVTWFNANENYLDVKHGTAHWNCYGGQMNVAPAVFEYHAEDTKLKGGVEISPPTHAYVQAYVRVR